MSNNDMFRLKAALIFKVPVEQVTEEQRRYAKQMTFPERYGNSQKLGDQLGKPSDK